MEMVAGTATAGGMGTVAAAKAAMAVLVVAGTRAARPVPAVARREGVPVAATAMAEAKGTRMTATLAA